MEPAAETGEVGKELEEDSSYGGQFWEGDGERVLSAFVCPITMQVMRDPVIVETGHTYEREAIVKWFGECKEHGRRPCCPLTWRELHSTDLNPSFALRGAIEEWRERSEAAQLRRASKSLTASTSEKEAVQALSYVIHACDRSKANKQVVRSEGIVPMIGSMLRSGSPSVRSKALEALQELAREKEDRESLSRGDIIRTIIKFIDREHCQERELAISLLYELSKSELVCEKISEVNGAILILGKVSGHKSGNLEVSEKAEKTLENMEKCEKNVVQMAENGRLQPLLNLLLEGSPEKQLLMASCLEKIVLSNDLKTLVARRVGSLFVRLVQEGSMREKEVAFKVLNHVSSNEESAKALIEADILFPLLQVLSTDGINCLPMRLQEAAAAVLANLVNSRADFGMILLDDNQTLLSEDVLHSLLHLISNTSPAIQCKLLEIFATLSSSTTTVLSVVSAIRSSGAITNLVQFVETDHQDSRVPSLKLLCKISFHMDRDIAQVFVASPTLLVCLVRVIFLSDGITDEQEAALGILANLPKRDTRLTRELMEQGAFKFFARKVLSICRREMCSNISEHPLLEGLIKVLSRITYALRDEPRCIALAREYNLASLFTSLLRMNGFDEVQVLSAKALLNLSKESKYLTGTPRAEESQNKSVFTWFDRKPPAIVLCRVHSGICSTRDNFCILQGKAVERLILCLDHENKRVVEAALSVLCTLVENGVEFAEGVLVLSGANGIEPIFGILKKNPAGSLQQMVIWIVERILRIKDIAKAASSDPSLASALVHAFQHGDSRTRENAERALKHIDKLPDFSDIFNKGLSIRGSSRGSVERYL